MMRSSSENVGTEYDWGHIMESHENVYIVKRPSYEFCFAMPRRQAAQLSMERPLLQVYFKGQCQIFELILEIDGVEDFFDGLSRLMEYVHAEEARRQEQL
jgi:hypothetical protein